MQFLKWVTSMVRIAFLWIEFVMRYMYTEVVNIREAAAHESVSFYDTIRSQWKRGDYTRPCVSRMFKCLQIPRLNKKEWMLHNESTCLYDIPFWNGTGKCYIHSETWFHEIFAIACGSLETEKCNRLLRWHTDLKNLGSIGDYMEYLVFWARLVESRLTITPD